MEHDDAPSIRQVPHNPMINAGAIMSVALVSKKKEGLNKSPTEVYSEVKSVRCVRVAFWHGNSLISLI